MRWCAVTGGRGFMARHLVAMLLRSGEWRVHILDLPLTVVLDSTEEGGLLGAALRDGRAAYIAADVCKLGALIKGFEGVEVVFHTAAPDPAKDNFSLHHSVNVEGTKNVIEACTKCKVKRLIYTSSSGVIFDGVHGLFDVDESIPYPDKFVDPYTQTKAEAEKLVMKANDMKGLLTSCVRPGSIFGPGDRCVPCLAYAGRKGMSKFIVGDGNNLDDFVYVENVAYGHICAERALSTREGAYVAGGQTYFITNMEPINLWEFISLVLEGLGYESSPKIKLPVSIVTPMAYVLDWTYKVFSRYGMSHFEILTPTRIKFMTLNRTFSCKKATDQLGYKPIVSLKEGMKITIESYPHLRAEKSYLEKQNGAE